MFRGEARKEREDAIESFEDFAGISRMLQAGCTITSLAVSLDEDLSLETRVVLH